MLDTSKRGVEVLRILALSVRSEQDFGLNNDDSPTIGRSGRGPLKQRLAAIRDYHYRPPYVQQGGYTSLGLRQALKDRTVLIPPEGGFFANNNTHDLILSGANQGKAGIAVISLIDLCSVIKSIPDERNGCEHNCHVLR